MTETRNLSALVHELRTAMAHGWRVELVLKSGASLTGQIRSMPEDRGRREAAFAARPNTCSQLLVTLAGGTPVAVEQIRDVRPAL
jgi:hypothetical protein